MSNLLRPLVLYALCKKILALNAPEAREKLEGTSGNEPVPSDSTGNESLVIPPDSTGNAYIGGVEDGVTIQRVPRPANLSDEEENSNVQVNNQGQAEREYHLYLRDYLPSSDQNSEGYDTVY